jgi:hypothetical protein
MDNTKTIHVRPVNTDTPEQTISLDSEALSRRRALLAGLAATPAILTLIGRPVWAQTATPSPALCASLAAGTSLHGPNQARLLEQCQQSAETTETITETTTKTVTGVTP